METGFIKVANKDDIPVGKIKKVRLGDKDVLIANVSGNFYAINDSCTHQGEDLSQGKLVGNIVECPKHHSKFDVTTGKVVLLPSIAFFHPKINDEKTYQVKVENEGIMIKP